MIDLDQTIPPGELTRRSTFDRNVWRLISTTSTSIAGCHVCRYRRPDLGPVRSIRCAPQLRALPPPQETCTRDTAAPLPVRSPPVPPPEVHCKEGQLPHVQICGPFQQPVQPAQPPERLPTDLGPWQRSLQQSSPEWRCHRRRHQDEPRPLARGYPFKTRDKFLILGHLSPRASLE